MFAVPPNTVALTATPASAHPALIALDLAGDPARWRQLLRFETEERFATLVESADGQEIWLMSWLPGQSTDLHDHGAATGAFTIVAGALTELVTHRGVRRLGRGQSRVFGPGYVHQVRNDGPEPAVSIHVYRPGRPSMVTCRLDSDAELPHAG